MNDIEHIESTTVNGIAIVKIFLQPNASIDAATAQVTAASQTILKQMPPGVVPPLIMSYNASTVPILQLALSGKGLSEQQLNDIGQNFLRVQLVTVPGAAVPYPYGGKQRQIMVNINPAAASVEGAVTRRCCERRQSPEPDSARREPRKSASLNTAWK